jgi:carbon dioxide concentrating mechanism protein CcmM
VERFGDVYIGERSFVAGNTVLRAAPDRRLDICSETNVQDNIIVRSLENSSGIGNETSLAHHAIVRDFTVGDFAFLGFDAEVIDSTIEDGVLISAGAFIENVTIPEDALVSPGAQITTQEQAEALEKVTEANEEFKREVLDVNAEFAEGYITLYEEEGYEDVVGVGPTR